MKELVVDSVPQSSRQSALRSIPGSTALIKVVPAVAREPLAEAEFSLQVHCGECMRRLFDLEEDQSDIHGKGDDCLIVERKCPSCHYLNRARVTKHDGQPPRSGELFDGAWYCAACDCHLGKIDAIRGRVFVTCRCKREARVVAGVALTAYREFALSPRR